MRPSIRSASLVDFREIAKSVGLDPYRMLKKAGCLCSCLLNPDMRISAEAVANLLEASASAARSRGSRATSCTTPRIVEPGAAGVNRS